MKLATATAKVRNAGFDTYTAGTGVLMVRLTNRPVDSIEVWRVLAEADGDEYAPEYENIDGEVAVTGLELSIWDTEMVKLTCDTCEKIFWISNSAWQSIAPDVYENGYKPRCEKCQSRKPHTPGTAPDTSLHLGNDRKEWLRQQGGIQPTIIRLIDEAMKSN